MKKEKKKRMKPDPDLASDAPRQLPSAFDFTSTRQTQPQHLIPLLCRPCWTYFLHNYLPRGMIACRISMHSPCHMSPSHRLQTDSPEPQFSRLLSYRILAMGSWRCSSQGQAVWVPATWYWSLLWRDKG